jgi:UDP-N-acetylglucosamine 2-epimerase (non-hydrolysing)/UDP-GlcNAc3NAcA epimerase
VIGNRPQFVKAAAVSAKLRDRVEEVVVHTGQHYDRELSEVFFEELKLAPPQHQLDVGSGTHAEQTGAVMAGLEPLVAEVAPDAMLVYGDTNSTLGAALVAAKASVPLAHVEAGMRSYNRTMPEEVNRVATDALSGLALCSTDTAVANLGREGLGRNAVLVGDVMADVALLFGPVADERSKILETLKLTERRYYVATSHRPGNVDAPERLGALVQLLGRIARRGPEGGTPVIFPAHPRTRRRLKAAGLLNGLGMEGVRVIDSLGYLDMTKLVRGARAVVTDSGGLQKEAFLASVPCVTLREETEWLETVETGWNRLVGLDAEAATAALDELPPAGTPSPAADLYGGGQAGERAAAAISDWMPEAGHPLGAQDPP